MLETEEFEQIDINSFFDSSELVDKNKDKAEIFTKRQRDLLNQLMPLIMSQDKEKAAIFLTELQTWN